MGFGFTIADSAAGQKNLNEGDVLMEINEVNVRQLSHSEVVQATITVTRGTHPPKNPLPKQVQKGHFKPKSGFLFRSKTPTGELYSTQEKEKVPNRPKTPLVDTRNMNRSKTPTKPCIQRTLLKGNLSRASMGGGREWSLPYAWMITTHTWTTTDHAAYSRSSNMQLPIHHSLLPHDRDNQGIPRTPSATPTTHHLSQEITTTTTATRVVLLMPLVVVPMTPPTDTPRRVPIGSLGHWAPDRILASGRKTPPWKSDAMARPERRATDMLEITVTLHRQDSGFGFRIVGGTEEGSQ
ncbi:Membraneassociated guanylate kinase_ WW and PDZ domaincontaining protein 1like, partial [Caligus rogercresseyi]